MGLLASLMYRALAWKERQRARRAASLQPEERGGVANPDLGVRGETLAYWYLRQAGYTVVARNWRARSGAGELDLVGWEGPILAFVEVKTRSASDRNQPTPEEAVNADKRRYVARVARQFVRARRMESASCRFDVLAIETTAGARPAVRLHKGAFIPELH